MRIVNCGLRIFGVAALASGLLLGFAAEAAPEIVPVGKGAYRLDLPPGGDGKPRRSVAETPSVSSGFSKPIPTSDWWSSLVWPKPDPFSQPMIPHPLAVKAEAKGLAIGYTAEPQIIHGMKDGKILQPGSAYNYPFRSSLRVGLKDWSASNAVLDDYSDWTVTALWETGSDELRATFGHGLPFVYFTKTGDKPVVVEFTAAAVNRHQTPVDPAAFETKGVTAAHLKRPGAFRLAVNAGNIIGVGSKARLVYDFDGDGKTDRVETFSLFATDPIPNTWETYDSERQALDAGLTRGEMRDFKNGTVRLEFWKCFGEGGSSLKLSDCSVDLPFADGKLHPVSNGNLAAKPDAEGIARVGSGDGGRGKVFHRESGALGVSLNGAHFGLFAPSTAEWQSNEDQVSSDLGGKDYFSVAVLPDNRPETIELFQRHAYAFVKDTRIDYAIVPEKSAVRTTFTAITERKEGAESNALMTLYRHQYLHLADAKTDKRLRYDSARGELRGLVGNRFETETPFAGVLPTFPISRSNRAELKAGLAADAKAYIGKNPFKHNDTYWNGKELGKVAELAQIADQLGEDGIRDQLVAALKTRLEDWFDGQEPRFFHYDKRWGCLTGYPDSYGSAETQNDHHFHYSYFVKAAATIAQFDPEWTRPENYGGMIDLLIRDCANIDRRDKRFAWMKNFDPYAGHSWASGHAGFAAGNNQESSSESMNFATALVLYGEATGNDRIRDLGSFWRATEAEAIRQYWFDVDGEVFPEGYEHPCAGIIWSDGATYGTWWTANPEEIHGINFLPFNAGSIYLGARPEYIRRNLDGLMEGNRNNHRPGGFPGPTDKLDAWQDIILQYQALAEPGAALRELRKWRQSGGKPEAGETATHTLHWILSLNDLGQFDAATTADYPTAAVFIKNGKRNYVIYNAGEKPVRVQFSNGKTFKAPRGTNRFPPP